MSTVLRPVGPLQPRVYWVRRGVVLGIVVVLIIIVAEVFSGGSAKPKAGNSHPGAHPSTSTSSSPATTPSQLAACDPAGLTLVLSTDTDTYTSGQAPKLTGVFTNTSSSTCTLSSSPAQETWTVKSGTAKIWTSNGCTSSDLVKQIRIQAGATKQLHTFWNGHLQESGCTEGAVAQPGTYTLHASLDGVKGKVAVFHITSG